MRKLVLFGSSLLPALMVSDVVLADHGGDVDTFCTNGTVELTIELGDGLPLPKEYSNSSGSEVTIIGTMNDNALFGPRTVSQITLDAHTGVIMSEAPVVPTSSITPLGSAHVVVEFTSSDTGGTVLATCDYNLTIVPPAEVADLVQIPVRWCAVEGSPQAEDKEPGEFVDGSRLIALLARLGDEITMPGMHVAFRPASAPDGIPVVADPDPDNFQLGDLGISVFGFGEAGTAIARCEQAWDAHYPGQRGTIMVNGRQLIAGGVLGGVAPAAPVGLWVASSQQGSGQRGNDLCGHPRQLTVGDVTPMLRLAAYDQALFGGNSGYTGPYFDPARVVAHELAHTLMISHGNGLDDNGDGEEPPAAGPRCYDEYCDPLGNTNSDESPVEDEATTFTSCEEHGSLMRGGCFNIRPLQAEMARAVAKLAPGATFDAAVDPAGSLVASSACAPPCGLPAELFLISVEMAETPASGITSFTHRVPGPLDASLEDEYLTFADLDDDPATGCDPSSIGFSAGFEGAELVTRVSLSMAGSTVQVTPTVWRCDAGTLVEIDDPSIGATAYTQPMAAPEAAGASLFGVVGIQMSNAVRGAALDHVRLQAITEELGGPSDLLPPSGDGGSVSLIPPDLPECETAHLIAAPGEQTGVQAHGLLPNHPVDVLFAGQVIATGSTNGAGEAAVDFVVPATLAEGGRTVTVVVHGTAQAASCALAVKGTRVTPATGVTRSPPPTGGGWNATDVTLSFHASDVQLGPGIDDITLSATGAQPLASTAFAGDSTMLVVSAEGETTVTFFATSESGASETPRSITVAVDKTDPTIDATRSPGPNAFGWNNTDVVVTFACADALSGVVSCTPPAVLATEGVDQSVAGTALDFAFNDASATLGDVDIDKTDPLIVYAGNEGSYRILDPVSITCTASDALSGLMSTTCVDIQGAAYTFQPGDNVFTADATDFAGNLGQQSTTFSVLVSYDDLCTLTMQLTQATTGNDHGTPFCAKLAAAETADGNGDENGKQGAIGAYVNQVAANKGSWLTPAQAQILYTWAAAL